MKKLKAFTLIEMLIVIVIIGILAAALIPRLSKARGRANDTARKADLSQVAAALVSYQIDKGSFPPECWNLEDIYDKLQIAGLDTLPTDPAWSTVNNFASGMVAEQYGYCAITKNGQWSGWFVIAAIAETEWWANFIQTWANLSTLDFDQIQAKKCSKLCKDGAWWSCDAACTYGATSELRYIYTQ